MIYLGQHVTRAWKEGISAHYHIVEEYPPRQTQTAPSYSYGFAYTYTILLNIAQHHNVCVMCPPRPPPPALLPENIGNINDNYPLRQKPKQAPLGRCARRSTATEETHPVLLVAG